MGAAILLPDRTRARVVAAVVILAIDDDEGRYDGLRRLLDGRAPLTVACCSECVAAALQVATVVLLDYDLDSGDPCACGDLPEPSGRKASAWVPWIIERGLPVIVTSCSWPENVDRLVADLRGRVPHLARHPAMEPECELRWLGRLWSWGLL